MHCSAPWSIRLAVLTCLLSLAAPMPAQAQVRIRPIRPAPIVQHRYHHLYHALWELRDARQYITESTNDFGGHREAGLTAIGNAIKQLDFILADAEVRRLPLPIRGDLRGEYKLYTSHPHLYHALAELRAAHQQLREDSHNFGGHKEAALRDMHEAIVQIDLMLHHNYHLYHALWELRDARAELKESKRAWGERKEKSLAVMSNAIGHIELVLKNSPEADRIEPTRGDLSYIYATYANYPHLHHCLHELREAERQLKESTRNYGGNREAAIREIHQSIVQLELLLDRAPK